MLPSIEMLTQAKELHDEAGMKLRLLDMGNLYVILRQYLDGLVVCGKVLCDMTWWVEVRVREPLCCW